ncbi:glycosyltransferase [Flavobacterium sp. Sd200]|uniref:glycosyltransferase family 2 protein n=1 Tax=Flavobacterium sp. Sd200 TaxID=2692211 RepID=UPI00136EBF80|nr:glycosyltransferase family 2 protein [Flavobacterium sp. Sd200]MXN92401.1 glycosyltransferase [Flavobacterium sp. Sd200]
MLSILIPTYNYNVFPLAQELQTQAKREHIDFEIIVIDDASTDQETVSKNQNIALIDDCTYILLQQNIGRSKIRNLLAQKANYHWLLFLDADTLPINKQLIANYLQYLNSEEKVVYGGIEYTSHVPPREKLLRWVYGREREALHVVPRQDMPYLSLLTLNFAITKSIFSKVSFNETIPNLRYEDVLFSYNLSEKHVKIHHVHNPVCHLGLDTSEKFIKKSEEATVGFKYLIDNHLIPVNYIRLGAAYDKIKKTGLTGTVVFIFNLFKNSWKKNLLSKRPSLFIFDVYRLGYLCSLK